jgi:hypothetical protein
MGQEGSCKVCNARALETIEHTFCSCEALEGMWEKVKFCRREACPSTRLESW